MAKAFMMLRLYDESLESIKFGLLLDKENKSLLNLLGTVNEKILEIVENNKKNESIRLQKERKEGLLEAALDLRQYKNVNTKGELPMPNETHLEEEDVIDSQMIFSATVMFPSHDSFDSIADISELSTPQELINIFNSAPEHVVGDEPKYSILDRQNAGKDVQVFMETLDGGLVKVSKKWTFNKILQNQAPIIPLINKGLTVYFASSKDTKWIKEWNREMALSQRL